MTTATTTKTYTHIMHFSNYEEMGYAHSGLESFVQNILESSEEEFDGDAPNEVVFTTTKPLSQAAIKRMTKHFDPKDSTFNQS